MKKRIGYFLLIIIAIVGSRLLYGINYDLNNQTEILTNIYRYDIIGKNSLLFKLLSLSLYSCGSRLSKIEKLAPPLLLEEISTLSFAELNVLEFDELDVLDLLDW